MASTSSSVGLVRGHTCCPARVASCWRGRTCPYRLHGRCWFSHDDDPEEDPPCRDVAATSCRVGAATASLGLPGRVRRPERIVGQIGGVLVPLASKGDVDGLVGEQIGAVLVPQIWEPIGEVVQLSPRERVQNRTLDQIVGIPVPQIMEVSLPALPQERVQNRTLVQIVDIPVPQISKERVQNRTLEQFVGVPVSQNTEDGLPIIPQESVQNRTPEQTLGFPVPQIVQESVLNRTLEQVLVSPVPQTMEAVVEVSPPTQQERVLSRIQKRVQNRPRRLFVDVPWRCLRSMRL